MSTANALRSAATGVAANPVAGFSKFLEQFKPQMALALPKHMNADRMARLALTSFSQSESLQKCDPKSIAASIMVAGQMGLEIGVSGQGYLVPYKGKCTFVPGWQGIVDIVNRSGRATVWTGAVFDGDSFDYALGDSPFVRHQPSGEDDPDKLTHVYAIGRVNGSNWPVIEVWPIARIQRHFQKTNKVGNAHYAFKHWEMYARKIPLLQVCKYMPKSIELTNAIATSHAAEEGRGVTIEGDFITVGEAETEVSEIVGKTPQSAAPATAEAKPSLAAYQDRLSKAPSQGAADILLDEARDALTADDLAQLNAAYSAKFPG